MNGRQEWEKNNNEFVDLFEVLKKLSRNMVWLILCGLIFAVAFGGYAYHSYRHKDAKIDYSERTKDIELTSGEEQQLQTAEKLHDEIEDAKQYMKNSIYINIDPYHVNTVTVLYGITGASQDRKKLISEAYLSFAGNGGLTEYLQNNSSVLGDMEPANISELIDAYEGQKQQVIEENTQVLSSSSDYFYIKIIGKDMDSAQKVAEEVKTALKQYSAEVIDKIGKHDLIELGQQQEECYDGKLEERVSDLNTKTAENSSKLSSILATFRESQRALYNFNLQQKGKTGEIQKKTELSDVVKNIIIGFLLGMFLYACIYCALYICKGVLESEEDFERRYYLRMFGRIDVNKDAVDESVARVTAQLKIVCKEKEIHHICVLPAYSLDATDKKYVDIIQSTLQKAGIQVDIMEKVYDTPEQWDSLSEIRAVVPIYWLGHTKYKEINQEMKFYFENNMEVLGVAALKK